MEHARAAAAPPSHHRYARHHLSTTQLVTATALVAAVMTAIMGVGGNLPLAVAAGLGLNAVVAFQPHRR